LADVSVAQMPLQDLCSVQSSDWQSLTRILKLHILMSP